jgi:hypothetical protein
MNLQANSTNGQVCLAANQVTDGYTLNKDIICSVDVQPLYIITSVSGNAWSNSLYQGAGSIGLWYNSPIWQNITNYPTEQVMQAGYTIQFSNMTALTFAQPNYVPTSNTSKIMLSTTRPLVSDYITLPVNVDGTLGLGGLFYTSEFSFGKTYTNKSESYVSILNNRNEYGSQINTTRFSLEI